MFDPASHVLLSSEAAALASAALTMQARVAERLLRVNPAAYDALDATGKDVWGQMVCLQVNYQVLHVEGIEYEGLADLQRRYRDELLSEAARIIRDSYFADGSVDADGVSDAVSEGSFSLDAVWDPEEDAE